MDDAKLKKACLALAKAECANYYDGQCVPKDCPCFVYEPRGWVCTWFFNAVLPLDQELQVFVNQKMTESPKTGKQCAVCGKRFIPTSNRQNYCRDCVKEAYRIANARRVRKHRAGLDM